MALRFSVISNAATYSLSRSIAATNEGTQATITLNTTGVQKGQAIPYTITGVSSADIGDVSLTGNFTIDGDTDSVVFNIAADVITEGEEVLTLTLDDAGTSVSVTINDTSVAPTYNLSTGVGSVDEGGVFTVTLNTTGLANGVTVPYTITGVSSADINNASLTGNFVINNNTSTQSFTVTSDTLTEGIETFTLTLDNNAASASVTINDTSIAQTGDPYWNQVVLLTHFDGTDGATTFTDVKGKTMSRLGTTPAISTTKSRFGGASVYLGTAAGNAVTVAASSDFLFTGDFTIECWVNFDTILTDSQAWYGMFGMTGTGYFSMGYFGNTNQWAVMTNSSSITYVGGPTATTNTWYHVALVRSGTGTGNLKMYVNGQFTGTAVTYTGNLGFNNQQLLIGARDATHYTVRGYIDEFRITRAARYTTDFTPPSAAFGETLNELVDPLFSKVSLLAHMDGTNGSTTFTDQAGHPLTAAGNAQITTSYSKFGGASGTFDGTGDYVYDTAAAYAVGTGEFTLECWVRFSSINQGQGIVQISSSYAPGTSSGIGFGLDLAGTTPAFFTSGTWINTSAPTPTVGVWYHYALTRASGVMRLFINGTQVGSYNDATNYTGSAFKIGGWWDNTYLHRGQIDELRLTKGVARYVSNFTVPTLPFPNSAS
jgi:hypothetical protein